MHLLLALFMTLPAVPASAQMRQARGFSPIPFERRLRRAYVQFFEEKAQTNPVARDAAAFYESRPAFAFLVLTDAEFIATFGRATWAKADALFGTRQQAIFLPERTLKVLGEKSIREDLTEDQFRVLVETTAATMVHETSHAMTAAALPFRLPLVLEDEYLAFAREAEFQLAEAAPAPVSLIRHMKRFRVQLEEAKAAAARGDTGRKDALRRAMDGSIARLERELPGLCRGRLFTCHYLYGWGPFKEFIDRHYRGVVSVRADPGPQVRRLRVLLGRSDLSAERRGAFEAELAFWKDPERLAEAQRHFDEALAPIRARMDQASLFGPG